MTLYTILYLVLDFTFGIGALALWALWAANKQEEGVRDWAISASCLFIGCLAAIWSRAHLSDAASMSEFSFFALMRSVASAINCGSWIFLWSGYRRFFDQKKPSYLTVGAIWLAFTIVILLAHPFNLPPAWALNWVSLCLVVFLLLILSQYRQFSRFGFAGYFALAGFVIVALSWGARGLLGVIDFERQIDGDFDSAVFILTILSGLMIFLGMSLLTQQRLILQLSALARKDSLTGALNRRAFFDAANALYASAIRNHRSLAVVLLDLDHFKRVNDQYGHQAGDAVLKNIVEVCHDTLRAQDVFGRYGGEEFIAVLPDADMEQAKLAVGRIREALAERGVDVDGELLKVTVSIGVSIKMRDDQALDELVRQADQALYQAKEAGRDRVNTFRGFVPAHGVKR